MLTIFKNKQVQDMLQLVKKKHAKQFRNRGRVPYWQHCLSVAEILASALEKTKELKNNKKLMVALICAALGHDLLEDTNIERKKIETEFGLKVSDLIENLTNNQNDTQRSQYMRKIRNAPDEARLIKYCDLIENTISCAYGIHDLGVNWVTKFFLPIKKETQRALAQNQPKIFSKTFLLLQAQLKFVDERLINNINKY